MSYRMPHQSPPVQFQFFAKQHQYLNNSGRTRRTMPQLQRTTMAAGSAPTTVPLQVAAANAAAQQAKTTTKSWNAAHPMRSPFKIQQRQQYRTHTMIQRPLYDQKQPRPTSSPPVALALRFPTPHASQLQQQPQVSSKPVEGSVSGMVAPRLSTPRLSSVPPPCAASHPPEQGEKPLDLKWMGVTLSDDDDTMEIHGTKEDIENIRKHPKLQGIAIRYIDINAVPQDDVVMAGKDVEPNTKPKTDADGHIKTKPPAAPRVARAA